MKKTQHEDILTFLKTKGTITPWIAFDELGITKLATRISELKRAGYNIKSEMVTVKARNGRTTKVCRYWLEEEKTASFIEHRINEIDIILAGDISKYLWNDLQKNRSRLCKELKRARKAK